jgi:predicted TIM-barrel fold metal-dependent hydrolase
MLRNFLKENPDIDARGGLIEFHAHLWGDRDGLNPRGGNEALLAEMLERFALDRMVVLPLFGGHEPGFEQCVAGNRAAAALARTDTRFCPFARVHPAHGRAAVEELRRCFDEGFFGLKIWLTKADAPEMDPLMELLVERGKPLLIHAMHKSTGNYAGESDPCAVAVLARRFPQAKIVMAHIGGNFLYGCEAVADCPNVWTDCSGTFCEQGMVGHAVRELGADRVIFGSDAPGADFTANLAKVTGEDLPVGARQRVLHDNAMKLLGL